MDARRTRRSAITRALPALSGSPESFLARERTVSEKIFWLFGVILVATILRWLAGFVVSGLPLLFYLPSVLLVTAIAGWQYGIACLVLSTVIGLALFGAPTLFTRETPAATTFVTLATWFIVASIIAFGMHFVRVALAGATKNELRFRQFLRAASDLICVTDEHGRVHEILPGWSRVTGMGWTAYRGRGWLDAIHPDDRARFDPETLSSRGAFEEDADIRIWDAKANDWRWFYARMVPVPGRAGGTEWITTFHRAHDLKLERDRQDLVVGELRHRLKNLVAVIGALAKGSRPPGEPEVDAFLKKFSDRLNALSAAADLMLAGQGQVIDVGATIRTTLAPFSEERTGRIRFAGPEVYVSEETGGNLAMAMHELATNAVKYGALSVPAGMVDITWSAQDVSDGMRVVIDWQEHGGPRPIKPEKEGFGGRVIRAATSRERDGQVVIDYAPEGVHCRIAFTKTTQGPPVQSAAA